VAQCRSHTSVASWQHLTGLFPVLHRSAVPKRNGAAFARCPVRGYEGYEAMTRLPLFPMGALLAAMAGLAGGCHLDKLLPAPSGEGPSFQTRPPLPFTGQPGAVPAGQPPAP